MWFGLLFMFVPGVQVRKLMYGCYQESVGVKIIIDRDTVPFAAVWCTVIAKFAAAIARNFELTFKVIDPAANQGRRVWWKILF
jgi:hypothetical protein